MYTVLCVNYILINLKEKKNGLYLTESEMHETIVIQLCYLSGAGFLRVGGGQYI